MSTDPFDVLHVLSVKGMAEDDALAEALARDPADVRRALDRLRADALAEHLPRRDAWRVTPPGRDRHATLLDDDTPPDARARLRRVYDRFPPLNLRFKDACARWQVHDGLPNDHGDADSDQTLVAELGELPAEAEQVIADLAGVRDRFGGYADRLGRAYGRLRAGDTKAFTGVRCGSYHDAWMELHRDLLLTLRIDRACEEAAA